MNKVVIKTDFIKLDQFLKYANIVSSGGEAKNIIIDGLVKVNNEICTQRGKKIKHNDVVIYNEIQYVVNKEE